MKNDAVKSFLEYIATGEAKMDAIMEGEDKGCALQKSEDEKIIAEKDAEIARLKELLAAKN